MRVCVCVCVLAFLCMSVCVCICACARALYHKILADKGQVVSLGRRISTQWLHNKSHTNRCAVCSEIQQQDAQRGVYIQFVVAPQN